MVEEHLDWTFAVLSQPIAPAVYWMNTSAAMMPGTHFYSLELSLVDTPLRRKLLEEGSTGLHWSVDGMESPVHDWLHFRRCSWARVTLPAEQQLVRITAAEQAASSPCTAMPRASSLAYRRIARCPLGNGSCSDHQTRRRIVDTSNEQRVKKRQAQGFDHVLTSSECSFRWFGEAALSNCLAGRSILNIGWYATDLQRGLARLNRSLVAWTKTRPGPTHPNVADFHRAFEGKQRNVARIEPLLISKPFSPSCLTYTHA